MKTVKTVIVIVLMGIAGQAMTLTGSDDIAFTSNNVSTATAAIYNGDLNSLKSLVEANPSILTEKVTGTGFIGGKGYLVDYANSLITAKLNPSRQDAYQSIYNYLNEKTPK